MNRCPWCESNELLRAYHDEEWGAPIQDDQKHFEFLVLESAQAGLSWMTVLRKREHYRAAYNGFDAEKVAAYGDAEMEALLQNPGLIRNRQKIAASIVNAQKYLEIKREFGSFHAYLLSFVDGKPIVNSHPDQSTIPATSPLSDRVSQDMKARGFKFMGSTVVYAHLQATGIVDDHIDNCFRKQKAE